MIAGKKVYCVVILELTTCLFSVIRARQDGLVGQEPGEPLVPEVPQDHLVLRVHLVPLVSRVTMQPLTSIPANR